MKRVLVIMTGIGFTLGVVFGLLLQLPIDNTLPAEDVPKYHKYPLSNMSSFRSRRSLSKTEETPLQDDHQLFLRTAPESDSIGKIAFSKAAAEKEYFTSEKPKLVNMKSTPRIWSDRIDLKPQKEQIYVLMEALRRPADMVERSMIREQSVSNIQTSNQKESFHNSKMTDTAFESGPFQKSGNISGVQDIKLVNSSRASIVVRVRLSLQKGNNISKENIDTFRFTNAKSHADSSYMSSIVNGILWSPHLEKSCPRPFQLDDAEAWRRRVEVLDVVNMEEGCGRMQNRLITFRDASKACARYRLNTDQIQGEIFSYYLARIFNVSNIPPTVLARVDTLSSKWRTVHLQLSLAHWADSKLVVLTQHIDGLLPAHIPAEFREEGRRLKPTLEDLGSKSHSQLCELVQWSDLIVFDYLTANLDRVINNMFNHQWNDHMMSSPAHNLEQQVDGSLVFLDNESGLFHGYRLLDKYSTFHRSLLQALCVFRPSTAETIKRLNESSSIGEELHTLFTSSEVLHKHLAVIPDKNIKILQQRINDVYGQILRCERLFNR